MAKKQAKRQSTKVERDANGRWKPGSTPNPGGRRKTDQSVIELAQSYTELAITTLAEIAADRKAASNSRVAACSHLLDRAWGRPPQSVTAEVSMFDATAARDRLLSILTARESAQSGDAAN